MWGRKLQRGLDLCKMEVGGQSEGYEKTADIFSGQEPAQIK